MDEYIKKTDLLESIGRNSITTAITFADGVSVYDTIKDFPFADVKEVVRCNECANAYRKNHISVMCGILNRVMLACDYCSYGAKIDGGNEE